MFDKLEAMTDRYRELTEAIAQQDVIQDYPRYQASLCYYQVPFTKNAKNFARPLPSPVFLRILFRKQ